MRGAGAVSLLLVLTPAAALPKESPDPVNRIFLVGDSAEWVETGLKVRPEDHLTIRAGSQVCFSGGREESCVRSSGWPRETYAGTWDGDAAACDDPFPEWNHAAVIAMIGEEPVLVGRQNTFAGREGLVRVAINDCSFDGEYHNEGQFSVVLVEENPTALAARSGRELIEGAIDAMGGKAIRGVKSLDVRAACTGPDGSSFTTEVTSIFPDQTLFKQSSDAGAAEWVAIADKAWRIDRELGKRESAKKMVRVIRGHEFHAMLFELDTRFGDHTVPRELEEGGTEVEPEAPSSGDAVDCERVEMRDEYGAPAAVCLDPETLLPVRLSFQPAGKKKEPTLELDLQSWTEIEGVRYLQKFTLRQGDDAFTYDYQEILPNSVDRAVFKAVSPRALKEVRMRLKRGSEDEATDTETEVIEPLEGPDDEGVAAPPAPWGIAGG